MSALNFNNVIYGGRLTAKPELKQTTTGKFVCSFTIAVNRKSKEKAADFFTCVSFDKAAETISKFFDKGSSIVVQGENQNRTWEDKNGNKHTVTELIVNQFYFVDSKTLDAAPDVPTTELADGEDLPF